MRVVIQFGRSFLLSPVDFQARSLIWMDWCRSSHLAAPPTSDQRATVRLSDQKTVLQGAKRCDIATREAAEGPRRVAHHRLPA
jgi:hypothetical protein